MPKIRGSAGGRVLGLLYSKRGRLSSPHAAILRQRPTANDFTTEVIGLLKLRMHRILLEEGQNELGMTLHWWWTLSAVGAP